MKWDDWVFGSIRSWMFVRPVATNAKTRYWYNIWRERVSLVIRSFIFSLFARTSSMLSWLVGISKRKMRSKIFISVRKLFGNYLSFPVYIDACEYAVLCTHSNMFLRYFEHGKNILEFYERLSLDRSITFPLFVNKWSPEGNKTRVSNAIFY